MHPTMLFTHATPWQTELHPTLGIITAESSGTHDQGQIPFTPYDSGCSNRPWDKHYINFWLKEQETQA